MFFNMFSQPILELLDLIVTIFWYFTASMPESYRHLMKEPTKKICLDEALIVI
uniref:Uncharacterized protein n=1 Tax=Arsenophonus nasoniae TaxID=638 RepID=D2TWC3_9GAMM|nr:hypothetical protein ARN_03450 [Arsenophonus nasoniae]